LPVVTVVVIGAGHNGLAMSRRLAQRSIDHVVLERGEVANAWRTQRWDSLRLLTPNWLLRLPDFSYAGDDPDGYLPAAELADFVGDYAKRIAAPLRANTLVQSVRADGDGYAVDTDQGSWRCRAVVVATGATAVPAVPAAADAAPPDIVTVTPDRYRKPDSLPPGGVLVVGASATGIQLADELHRSGRTVTLATGEHVRLPRTYRGRDILWWMESSGLLDDRYDEIPDLTRARSLPSMQLVGSPERVTLDLNSLQDLGVRIVGKFGGFRDDVALFSGGLRNVCKLADLKLARLLDGIDLWAASASLDDADHREPVVPTRVPDPPVLTLDLRKAGITSIVWATGFRPDHSWLHAGRFDHRGRILHEGGIAAPGLYVLGLPFLRRRKSTLVDGANADTAELVAPLATHLDASAHH
jgi:putative flavoprotein involved in K+ transport